MSTSAALKVALARGSKAEFTGAKAVTFAVLGSWMASRKGSAVLAWLASSDTLVTTPTSVLRSGTDCATDAIVAFPQWPSARAPPASPASASAASPSPAAAIPPAPAPARARPRPPAARPRLLGPPPPFAGFRGDAWPRAPASDLRGHTRGAPTLGGGGGGGGGF